jgi:hypothetical protein
MHAPKDTNKQTSQDAREVTQPFFYEIRVRGRLSAEQWTAWFSNLRVSTDKGESTLRGSLPDHAALYGLLARLRDLAVPLLAVNVLDAEAWRKLHAKSRRLNLLINGVLLTLYLMLVGGLVAVTTFLTSGGYVHPTLALAMLFASVGALAYVMGVWSEYAPWRWLSYASWAGSLLTFILYTSATDLLPSAISVALLLFSGAGGLIYLASYLRNRATRVTNAIVEWESSGDWPVPAEQKRTDTPVEQDNS